MELNTQNYLLLCTCTCSLFRNESFRFSLQTAKKKSESRHQRCFHGELCSFMEGEITLSKFVRLLAEKASVGSKFFPF